ncbi:MAG TPA: hypothetical protein VJL59_04450 [Anaerolineales bacterium]|nr:hypothetical protein [Anaerolineales bacterium]
MTVVPLTLKLSDDKLQLLADVARARQSNIDSVLEAIVLEWLEREARLRRARQTLVQFSLGIGNSQPPYDAARRHDAYLYGKA